MYKAAVMLALFALAPAVGMADTEPTYFGVCYVTGDFDAKQIDQSFDVVGLGAILGRELVPGIAVEGRLGGGLDQESTIGTTTVTARVQYWASAFARAYLPLDRVRPYALAGFTTGKARASAGGIHVSDSDQDVSYGVGLELYADDQTAAFLECVRYMDTDTFSVEAASLGMVHHF